MKFEVKARHEEGVAVSTLHLEAFDAKAAAALASSQGYLVLGVRAKSSLVPWLEGRGGKFPLMLFSQELCSLLNAGLSLVESLEALAEKEQRTEVRQTIEKIVKSLYEGMSFSAALHEFPAIFPPLYVATVRASETTGGVGDALGRFVAYQSQLDVVRKKIISASVYPALLIVAGSLVMLFLLAYVVPKFAAVYEGMHGNLPWLSQLLLSWGALLRAHGLAVMAASGVLLFGMVYGLSRPAVREGLTRRLWQIPALGERVHIYQLARFYRTLGMLLRGGIPIVPALGMVGDLLPAALHARMQQALHALRQGQAISQAMEAHGLTTPVALRMLRVGEHAGNMGEMMERIAVFYDEEIARWVDWFIRLFEPILMAIIGLVIGVIVVLMYLPIFELAGSIQ